MNLFAYKNVVTGRIFAVLTAVSMILSALPVHIFVAEAALNGVTRQSDAALFATLQAAHDDAGTLDGDTLRMVSNENASVQITITKDLTIDGDNHTLYSSFARVDNTNNSAIGIQSDGVTVKRMTIDGSGGTDLHGINVYVSDDVNLNNLTFIDVNRTAVVVNGSEVTVKNITTSGSGWNAMNADQGGGVTAPSVLTVIGTSAHAETSPIPQQHIKVDDNTKDVTVNDANNQYDKATLGVIDAYTLKQNVSIDEIQICHANNGVNNYTNPTVSTLSIINLPNGHNNHDTKGLYNKGDIIPPFSYDNGNGIENYPGKNWTTDYSGFSGEEVYNNDCSIPEPDPEITPEVCSYEGVVVSYTDPAFNNGGNPVAAARREVSAVEAGVAPYTNFFGKEGNDWQVNPLDFFSLGIAGEIVYEFTDKIALDTAGDDIAIWEITGGPAEQQADEKVEVFLSEDGTTFVSAGTITGDGSVDISGTGLSFVKFVKLVDQSQGVQGSNGDGYDLDAITIIDDSCGESLTIVATKIVCEDESMLPNWGGGSVDITETTAQDFVDTNTSCWFEEGWDFQWGPQSTFDAGDTLIGEADAPWTTFGPTDMNGVAITELTEYDLDKSSHLWFREVLQEGYIPFTHDQNGNTNADDVSAEVYCASDVLNYDNYDRIDGVELDETYYCVAFNAEVPTYTIDGYKWNDLDGGGRWEDGDEQGLAEWKIALRPLDMDAFEALHVSAETDAVVTTAGTLVSGRTYIVEVSGTYSFGNRPDFEADAEWSHRTDSYQDAPLAAHGWTIGELTYPSVVGLDLQIDGQNIVWGSFNDDHLYKTMIEGDDSTLDFSIFDSNYSDNAGGLDVTIYDVTDYVTYTNGQGYYSFEVPEGEYQIIEEMVEGWTQTYPTEPSYYHVTAPGQGSYDFGNQQDVVPQGELIVEKVIVGIDGLADQFSFSVNGETPIAFEFDGSNTLVLNEGIYSITETSVADYDVTYEGCTDIDVQELVNVVPVCTITNTYHPPAQCIPGTELLENRSFEEPVIGSAWSLVTPVAWLVETLGGGSLLDMEIQANVNGWNASDGEQYTELDSTESSQMSQIIDTVLGATYSLSWDFAGRPHREVFDNHLEVLVDGTEVADNQNAGGGDDVVDWEADSVTFIGTGSPMEVMFRDAGTSNSYGTFVDNVSLTCEPVPEAGPYCGDTEVNQDWEQCEIGDEGCTNYCTWENQCQDLQLVKVTLTESPDSVSFNDGLYLGSDSNPIPNGTWFNFNEIGDGTVQSTARDSDGLGIERTATGLRLAVEGDNSSREFDYAFGTIEVLGLDMGALDRNPVVGWPLENTGSYVDVFNETGNVLDFKFWLTTGDDAAEVELIAADNLYDCPSCVATVEARVVLDSSEQEGNGHVNEGVILGDGSYYEYGEWFPITSDTAGTFITDPVNVTNFTNPETLDGLFVSREGDGTVKVALYGYHDQADGPSEEALVGRIEIRDASVDVSSYADLLGHFKLETHGSTGFDTTSIDTQGVDFSLFVNTKADGFRFSVDIGTFIPCEDDSHDPTYRIDGYKWNDEDGDGEWGEESAIAGWTIEVTNGVDTYSTTTDLEGYYYFDLPEGEWTVTEIMQDNWAQTGVRQNERTFSDESLTACIFTIGNTLDDEDRGRSFIFSDYGSDYYARAMQCDFGNYYTEPSNGGGGGGGRRTPDDDGGNGEGGTPQVLGEQVSLVPNGAPDAGAGGAAPADVSYSVIPAAFVGRKLAK